MQGRSDRTLFLDEAEYLSLVEVLTAVSTIVLFQFARATTSVRDTIIRNSIARGATTLASIGRIWPNQHYSDCWSLFRILVDRLFHLHTLSERDEFHAFEEWSFVRRYEAINRTLSDPDMRRKFNPEAARPTTEQQTRYRTLKAKPVRWSRPNPRRAAVSLGLPFLYNYAYDFASMHVHPMADDGQHEFLVLTGLPPLRPQPDQRAILHDSILVMTVLLQEALNASTLGWHTTIYDFIDHIRAALKGDTQAYRSTYREIIHAGPEMNWCEPRSPSA